MAKYEAPDVKPILSTYRNELKEAYEEAHNFNEKIDLKLKGADYEKAKKLHDSKRSANRRCAALSSAASKRAKRAFVFAYLRNISGDPDFTITNVHHCVNSVLGRSVDRRAIAEEFGTPDRTAADKSDWSHEDLKDLIIKIETDLKSFQKSLASIRGQMQEFYADLK